MPRAIPTGDKKKYAGNETAFSRCGFDCAVLQGGGAARPLQLNSKARSLLEKVYQAHPALLHYTTNRRYMASPHSCLRKNLESEREFSEAGQGL